MSSEEGEPQQKRRRTEQEQQQELELEGNSGRMAGMFGGMQGGFLSGGLGDEAFGDGDYVDDDAQMAMAMALSGADADMAGGHGKVLVDAGFNADLVDDFDDDDLE